MPVVAAQAAFLTAGQRRAGPDRWPLGRPGERPQGFGALAGEPSRTRSCGNPAGPAKATVAAGAGPLPRHQLDLREIRQAGPGELSAEAVAGYLAKYATAMIRLVVAVGSDPVRHRGDAWPWICRPATATTAIAAVAWV
jgi:hypothetical protein